MSYVLFLLFPEAIWSGGILLATKKEYMGMNNLDFSGEAVLSEDFSHH